MLIHVHAGLNQAMANYTLDRDFTGAENSLVIIIQVLTVCLTVSI